MKAVQPFSHDLARAALQIDDRPVASTVAKTLATLRRTFSVVRATDFRRLDWLRQPER
jgi:hypothetical protein